MNKVINYKTSHLYLKLKMTSQLPELKFMHGTSN